MKPICVCHNVFSLLQNHHVGCASGIAKKEEKEKEKEKKNVNSFGLTNTYT
jgi:hypothetical protein